MIHELPDRFDDRNMFLQVALGMLSVSRRFEALLAAQPAATDMAADDAPRGDDSFLYFVLGLLSFSQRVTAYLDAARVDQPASAPRRQPPSLPVPRMLLV